MCVLIHYHNGFQDVMWTTWSVAHIAEGLLLFRTPSDLLSSVVGA